jgi:hypothetical protein
MLPQLMNRLKQLGQTGRPWRHQCILRLEQTTLTVYIVGGPQTSVSHAKVNRIIHSTPTCHSRPLLH